MGLRHSRNSRNPRNPCLPSDVLRLIFSYAALHSNRNISRTCKAVHAYTRKRAYWEHAVSQRLSEKLTGEIDAKRLALIDVFAGLEDDSNWDAVCSRLRWMYCIDLWEIRLLSSSSKLFGIKANLFSNITICWQWHTNDYYNFVVHQTGGFTYNIYYYPLHPVVRTAIMIDGGQFFYEIIDRQHQRRWIGPATFFWDETLKCYSRQPELNSSLGGKWYPFS